MSGADVLVSGTRQPAFSGISWSIIARMLHKMVNITVPPALECEAHQ